MHLRKLKFESTSKALCHIGCRELVEMVKVDFSAY